MPARVIKFSKVNLSSAAALAKSVNASETIIFNDADEQIYLNGIVYSKNYDLTNIKRTDKIEVSTPATSITLQSDKVYEYGTLSNACTISFANEQISNDYCRHYIIRFTVGNNFSMTLPNNVTYCGGTTPTYIIGRTYEIDVLDDLAIVAEFYS